MQLFLQSKKTRRRPRSCPWALRREHIQGEEAQETALSVSKAAQQERAAEGKAVWNGFKAL